MRAARNSILINIALSALKLFAGIFAHSAAMVSDAVHSIADLISTAIAMIGVKLSTKQPDKEHPYGHERFECVAALILSAVLFVTGLGIGWAGIQRILAGDSVAVPGVLALVAAAVSIGVKEGVYWYMRRAAQSIDSSALMADAWHSRIDGLSSIGSFRRKTRLPGFRFRCSHSHLPVYLESGNQHFSRCRRENDRSVL